MNRNIPVTTDIVLIGGGHAHVHVLKTFAARPLPGVRVTLVTRDLETPYSGMLPGVIAGIYTPDEAHIDLVRLTALTGTRLIHAEAIGLDRVEKRVLLAGRPAIDYDILSIDVGITPDLAAIAGAAKHGIAVKPIGAFLAKLEDLRARCRAGDVRRIAVVGGGAGGVELLLSLRTRLRADAAREGRDPSFSFALVTADALLATHHARVRAAFAKHLAAAGVEVHTYCGVTALTEGKIMCRDGREIPADAVLLATQAAPPAWFAQTGLARDAGGFLAVTATLQVANDQNVFAAGDCAGLIATPREKAGVYAVRAGPPLATNLARRAAGRPLRPWHPQRRHLALISTGDRYAVASRGAFKAEGAWLWRVKDFIDRRWMDMYCDPARIRMKAARGLPAASRQDEMRCGGCAAKVGAGPLRRALARLAPEPPGGGVTVGLAAPDDAAVWAPPAGGAHIVATVDLFRSIIDDAYVFGEIAANHALNDIFAMGGTPLHALAIAMVPPGPAAKTEEALFEMLSGARACLDREGVTLAGGHSAEGAETALGFSVYGEIAPGRILRKGGLRPGDALDPHQADRNRHPVRRPYARRRHGRRDCASDRRHAPIGARSGADFGRARRHRDDGCERLRPRRPSRRNAFGKRRRGRTRPRFHPDLPPGAGTGGGRLCLDAAAGQSCTCRHFTRRSRRGGTRAAVRSANRGRAAGRHCARSRRGLRGRITRSRLCGGRDHRRGASAGQPSPTL